MKKRISDFEIKKVKDGVQLIESDTGFCYGPVFESLPEAIEYVRWYEKWKIDHAEQMDYFDGLPGGDECIEEADGE